MKNSLFIANWKMNKSFTASLDFCTTHKQALKKLSSQAEIVICPSFPALFSVAHLLKDTKVRIGAQTCSMHEKGAYTGQVNTLSLKEVGCTYCIVGHSEQRRDAHLTNDDVAKQVHRLLAIEMQPIICIGETKEEFAQHISKTVLEHQLNPILKIIQSFSQPIIIAYEPIWSIGTGTIPPQAYLDETFGWLAQKLTRELRTPWRILYGGSITPDTIASLKGIAHLDGFLIGDASLDFQKFEKIVSWEN